MPADGPGHADLQRLDQIIGRRRRLARDERLYRMGEPFTHLYAARFGHFKTRHADAAGEARITGFQMAGELLGMDALGGTHHCDAVALEDSEVCEIPYGRLAQLCAAIPGLLRHFHRILSQEITREQKVMLLLGNMRAEERLAVFLAKLSARYAVRLLAHQPPAAHVARRHRQHDRLPPQSSITSSGLNASCSPLLR